MIKAIIFDWGGVLIENPESEMTEYVGEKLGKTAEEVMEVYHKYEHDFRTGNIPEKDLWMQISQDLEVSTPTQQSLWREAFVNAYKPREEVFALAESLKKKGYQVGFLSNTEKPAEEYFKEQNYGMFDITVFSCAEGIAKPEAGIYEVALKRLGVNADEAVFIDDKETYVEGAKKVGMLAIQFKDIKQLKEELEKLGVES